MATSRTTDRRPRRAPRAGERGRVAEATRQRILDAAVREFGAKGYAGARTAGIAARAGVNQQLLAYYFGGKQGVLDELRRRWSARQQSLVPPGADFSAALAAHLDETLDNLDWARMVIWCALGDGAGGNEESADSEAPAQHDRLRDGVDRIGQHQRNGELTSAVDPEFVMLLAYAIAFAPVAMPQVVSALFAGDPGSPTYRRRCHEQLMTLLRRSV